MSMVSNRCIKHLFDAGQQNSARIRAALKGGAADDPLTALL